MAQAKQRPVAANDNYPTGKRTHQRPTIARAIAGKLAEAESRAVVEIERLVRAAEVDPSPIGSALSVLSLQDLNADRFDADNNRPAGGIPDGFGEAVVLRQGRTPEWWTDRASRIVDLSAERLQAPLSARSCPHISGNGLRAR